MISLKAFCLVILLYPSCSGEIRNLDKEKNITRALLKQKHKVNKVASNHMQRTHVGA